MKDYLKKVEQVDRYLRNKEIILDIKLIDYEGFNLYFRLDYFKKLNICKISWIDFDVMVDNRVERYLNTEIFPISLLEKVCDLIERNDSYDFVVKSNKNIVEFTTYYLTNNYHFLFNKYLPKELVNLSEIFITIFNYLPRRLTEFLVELQAEVMNTRSSYEYQDCLFFDLFHDNLESLFDKSILDRGKSGYENNEVIFLEKFDDKYYAVVKGNEEYLVIIKYDEINVIMEVYCTCPCEFFCRHIAMVIFAIRNGYENKFYKVLSKRYDANLLEMAINKYYLSIGLVEDYIKIINKYGEIEYVPLFDKEGNVMWKILEDSDDGSLLMEIKKVIDK